VLITEADLPRVLSGDSEPEPLAADAE
jgi:hypothetical protein